MIGCKIIAVHVPGKNNELADDLSRNRHLSFLSKAPYMEQSPSPVPIQLPPLLLDKGNWMCLHWTQTFTSIFTEVWMNLHIGHIEPA